MSLLGITVSVTFGTRVRTVAAAGIYLTGSVAVTFRQMTRVRNAQQLLLYTDMKIADITAHCGFTSFSQFNRVFNKFCHTSPSQFRLNGSAGITPANNYIQLPAESREA